MVGEYVTLADLNSHVEKFMETEYAGYNFTGFRARQTTIDVDGELVRLSDGKSARVDIFGYDAVAHNDGLMKLAESKIREAVAAMPWVK